jgi:3-isopropylmalate dehydrogenase
VSNEGTHRVAVIGGDGIGPEVTAAALDVVRSAGVELDTTSFDSAPPGTCATASCWMTTPWRNCEASTPSCSARSARPSATPASPAASSSGDCCCACASGSTSTSTTGPSRRRRFDREGCDFAIVRENTEGPYAGEGGVLRRGTPHEVATQGSVNTRFGVERCVRYAFELARRWRTLGSPWCTRPTCSPSPATCGARRDEVAAEFPRDVRSTTTTSTPRASTWSRVPSATDVIVTDNLFGDILSDLAGAVTGGIGFAASANLNPARTGPRSSSRSTAPPTTSPAPDGPTPWPRSRRPC